jgi:hypothetical protein
MLNQYEEFETLLQARNLQAAEERLFAWIRDHPTDSHAWMLYGKSVTTQHQKRDCFKRALSLDPSNLEAEMLLKQLDPLVSQPPQESRPLIGITNNPPKHAPPLQRSEVHAQSSTLLKPKKIARGRTKHRFLIYSFLHFLFTLFLGVILVLISSLLVPGLVPILRPNETVQRGWLGTSVENETLTSLENIFLNPSNLDYQSVSDYENLKLTGNKIDDATTTTETTKLKGAIFICQLVGGSVLTSSADGKALIVVMEVDFDGNQIPVVYYGPVENFHYGDTLQIEGVLISDNSAVIAQRVQQLKTSQMIQSSEDSLLILRVTGIVLLWTLFCISVFLWSLNKRRWRPTRVLSISPILILLCLFLLSILLTGCTIEFSTTLRPDGTGITTILAQESIENMDFLRSSPGVSGYFSALIRDVRESGAMFEQYIQGDQEYFQLQRFFNNTDVVTENPLPIDGSWMTIQQYTEDDEEVLRFLCVVDTRVLYTETEGISSEVANALHDQLDQISMTYHLKVPGQIVYHNGDEAIDQFVTWQLRMNESNYLVAETRYPVEKEDYPNIYNWLIWIAICLIFMISFTFLIASFFLMLPSAKAGREA